MTWQKPLQTKEDSFAIDISIPLIFWYTL